MSPAQVTARPSMPRLLPPCSAPCSSAVSPDPLLPRSPLAPPFLSSSGDLPRRVNPPSCQSPREASLPKPTLVYLPATSTRPSPRALRPLRCVSPTLAGLHRCRCLDPCVVFPRHGFTFLAEACHSTHAVAPAPSHARPRSVVLPRPLASQPSQGAATSAAAKPSLWRARPRP